MEKKRIVYNVSFIAYFAMLVLCASMRLVIYAGGLDFLGSDEAISYAFSIVVQILFLGAIPVLALTLCHTKNLRATFSYLGFRKPKPYIFLGFLLGVVGFFANYIIALASNVIWSLFGFHGSGGSFSIYTVPQLLTAVACTAILPGVCEEIAHRGMVLCAQKSTGVSEKKMIVLGGLLFGLFHMYLGQTVFAAIMGGVMVFITLRSKSILPAVFMHFTNNFMQVWAEFSYLNGLFGDFFYDSLLNIMNEPAPAVILIVGCLFAVPLLFVLLWVFGRLAVRAGDYVPKPKTQGYYPYPVYPTYPYGYGQPQQPMQPMQPQQPMQPMQPPVQQQPMQPPMQPMQPPMQPQQFNPFGQEYGGAPAGWVAVQPPLEEDAVFNPKYKDRIFYYASFAFASVITFISYLLGL